MLDVGWTEMLVIAVVMIVVVGPKDLPKMLRTFGKMTTKMRSMAGDFQRQFNEALKEAELDDVKKSVDTLRGLNPANQIKQHLNPFEKAAADVRAGLQSLNPTKPPSADPAAPTAQPAEPLKNGAAELPADGLGRSPEQPAQAVAPAPAPAPSPAPAAAAAPAPTAGATAAPSPEPANGVLATPMADPAPAKAPRVRKSTTAKVGDAARIKAPKAAGTGAVAKASATPRRRTAPKSAPAVDIEQTNADVAGAANGTLPGKPT